MNDESNLLAKIDELVSISKRALAESITLRQQVEALQAHVAKLEERLIYREKVLVGWKEIAGHLGWSVWHVQDLEKETEDPIPVFREGKMIYASATAIDAWRMRRREYRNIREKKITKVVIREQASDENPS